ncbi:hypothetical protein BTHE_1986 [Bifidobacterium thermophilum]|nr:hypothetical protein BTHE_1986 [Bifidobacterium thermophilum]
MNSKRRGVAYTSRRNVFNEYGIKRERSDAYSPSSRRAHHVGRAFEDTQQQP